MRAIETEYAGCRFRSRLEARWAVLFDALGLVWNYEPEGFDLGPVGRYLPDFFVPAWGAFVEVKPAPPTPIEDELCRQLGADGRRVVMFAGEPWPFRHEVRLYGPRAVVMHSATLARCRRCPAMVYLGHNQDGDPVAEANAEPHAHECENHDKWAVSPEHGAADVMAAYRAARSARFEFGDTPTRPG